MDEHYGIFNDFFNQTPNHLPLLNLKEIRRSNSEYNLTKSLKMIDELYEKYDKEDYKDGIVKMLSSKNWRPQLVSCFAIMKLGNLERNEYIELVWQIIKDGSWVKPQLIVLLTLIDEDFLYRAKKFNRFVKDISNMNPLEQKKLMIKLILLRDNSLEDKSDIAFRWRERFIGLMS